MPVPMWDSSDDLIQEMLENGILIDYYMSPDGEWICRWDMKRLEAEYPDVHKVIVEAQLEEVEELLMGMVDKGLLELSFQTNDDGTLEEVYSLTDLGRKVADEERDD